MKLTDEDDWIKLPGLSTRTKNCISNIAIGGTYMRREYVTNIGELRKYDPIRKRLRNLGDVCRKEIVASLKSAGFNPGKWATCHYSSSSAWFIPNHLPGRRKKCPTCGRSYEK